MQLTPENLQRFWNEGKKFKRLFNKEVATNFKSFVEMFVSEDKDGKYISNGLFWVIDDFVGIFYLTDITTGLDAIAHFTFFDRKLYGRAPLARALVQDVFNTYGLRRISAEAPEFLGPRVMEFIQEIGFKKEGIKRKAAYYDGKFHNKVLYGILPEDLVNTMSDSEVKAEVMELSETNSNG
jgi:RimJ/RimL family protein N-acetyltransferase